MSAQTFFFYDLETSGLDPGRHRIMQFAGQRTNLHLEPIGSPLNILVKLTDEVLPDPGAILVTGITPQETLRDGICEAEFASLLHREVLTPGTIMTGFNSVNFDDEFLRFLFYRNFYDPYTWAYTDERSRWDLINVLRLTRALRPEGIEWPVAENGKSSFKLVDLAAANGLLHEKAHDALSDVEALISVSRLLLQTQPKLFQYLLDLRLKSEVVKLVQLENPKPLILTSTRISHQFHYTSIVYPIGAGTYPSSTIVFDLRQNPDIYLAMNDEQLESCVNFKKNSSIDLPRSPIFEIASNKCPALAPTSVLTPESTERISISKEIIAENLNKLIHSGLIHRITDSFKITRNQMDTSADADEQLYLKFIGPADKNMSLKIINANKEALRDLKPSFQDERLSTIFPHYKARNFPEILSLDELVAWEKYRLERLTLDGPTYAEKLIECAESADARGQLILQDLELWAQSLAPAS